MLFVDLEGSTRLAQGLGPGWPPVLAAFRTILRAALAHAGGRIESTEGDSFFASFGSAAAALAAAEAAQRSLRTARPAGVDDELRARMGVHVGDALRTDGHLVGIEVHRAARVASAAHGGQVLVTGAAVADAGAGHELDALGPHRLKDFADTTDLWHLVVHSDRRASAFPSPRTAAETIDHDPLLAARPLDATIGRDDEIRELVALVREGARLVTLVGPGGVGKSRVAGDVGRAAQAAFPDGARLVPLAAVADADRVPEAIARVLRIRHVEQEDVVESLVRVLSRRRMLLILDNFEQILPAASVVSLLTSRCPGVSVLVTSREPLRLAGERTYALAPLAVSGVSGPAVDLFLRHGRPHGLETTSGDDRAAVAEICRMIDGLPLAIELTAPALALLTPAQIAERLRRDPRALAFPGGTLPERHQTLEATLAWSHDLLTPEERHAFACFGAFARGGTIATTEAITGHDVALLQSLAAKSLLQVDRGSSEPRLHMLETVLAFARERLEGDPAVAAAVRRRHFEHFLAFAEAAAESLRRTGAGAAAAAVDVEIDELRAALAWVLEHGTAEEALRLVSALNLYWRIRDPHEGAPYFRAALQRVTPVTDRAILAEALHHHAFRLRREGDQAGAEAAARQSLDLHEQLDDPAGIARSLIALVRVLPGAHRAEEAEAAAGRAVEEARRAGDDVTLAHALAAAATHAPRTADALRLGDDAAVLLRAAGHLSGLCWLYSDLAYSALCAGEEDVALRLLPMALAAAEEGGGWTDATFVIGNLGVASLLADDLRGALRHFRRELREAVDFALEDLVFESVHGLAAAFAGLGQDELAARLAGAAAALGQPGHDPPLQERIDRGLLAPARARDPQRWEVLETAGRALGRDEVVGLALSATDTAGASELVENGT